jgi:hypothetical protein
MPDERSPASWQSIAESVVDDVTEVAFAIANVIIDGSPSARRQLAQAPWIHAVGVADCTRDNESYLLTITVQLVHEPRPPVERKLRIVRGDGPPRDGASG